VSHAGNRLRDWHHRWQRSIAVATVPLCDPIALPELSGAMPARLARLTSVSDSCANMCVGCFRFQSVSSVRIDRSWCIRSPLKLRVGEAPDRSLIDRMKIEPSQSLPGRRQGLSTRLRTDFVDNWRMPFFVRLSPLLEDQIRAVRQRGARAGTPARVAVVSRDPSRRRPGRGVRCRARGVSGRARADGHTTAPCPRPGH
jgi:hypothetical protein